MAEGALASRKIFDRRSAEPDMCGTWECDRLAERSRPGSDVVSATP
jgi:hypothetical protein